LAVAVAEQRGDNSPAIYGWGKRQPNGKVPRGTAERFFRPRWDFGKLRASSPSHKWLGYFQVKRRDAENGNRGGCAPHSKIVAADVNRLIILRAVFGWSGLTSAATQVISGCPSGTNAVPKSFCVGRVNKIGLPNRRIYNRMKTMKKFVPRGAVELLCVITRTEHLPL